MLFKDRFTFGSVGRVSKDERAAMNNLKHAGLCGYVYVAGRQVGAEPVRVGMAFQNPTLLPWLTLLDNVMLPLKIVPPYRQEYRSKRKGEFRDKIEALLAQVGLAGFSNKFPCF